MNLGVRFDHYDVFTPTQNQLAFTFPTGLTIPNQTFPEAHYLKWDSLAPRLGISYDIQGNGKTVLKANYGIYKFNPGVGIADQANPNQSSKTVTYNWTDSNNDRTFQPNEAGTLSASALSNSVLVDPNLKQPSSTQATVYLERQISEGVGARVGFVYYSVNDQTNTYQNQRPASAYSVPFNFVDKGPDNITGTADDKNLTFYGIPTALISGCNANITTPTANCQYPTTQMLQNAPQNGKYKTVEFSLNKRASHNYSLGAGFGYTWKNDYPLSFNNTPNGPFNYDYRDASFKINGMYNAPWGINISPVYRFQAGVNFARTIVPAAPASCACTFSAARGGSLANTTVYADAYGDNKQDNISVLDIRVEKTVNLGSAAKVRLFLDGFNMLNSYAAETLTVSTGNLYLQPTAILGPRTGRIGVRFIW
jgi:hypothetical protein